MAVYKEKYMIIKTAEFVTSVASADKLGQWTLPQFAFVGRSNVGKSTLLNALVNRNKLAKTSNTPGRTRLINIFEINKQFYFVDLPGYGYAKASKEEQATWQKLIGAYLENSENLKMAFVLVDSRREPTERDLLMVKYLYTYQIPFQVVITKTDKLSRVEMLKNKSMIASTLKIGLDDVITVSAEKKENLQKLWEIIEKKLDEANKNSD